MIPGGLAVLICKPMVLIHHSFLPSENDTLLRWVIMLLDYCLQYNEQQHVSSVIRVFLFSGCHLFTNASQSRKDLCQPY